MSSVIEIDGSLLDVRSIYRIGALEDKSLTNPYYQVWIMGGGDWLIYESHFSREKLVQAWRECLECHCCDESESKLRRVIR